MDLPICYKAENSCNYKLFIFPPNYSVQYFTQHINQKYWDILSQCFYVAD